MRVVFFFLLFFQLVKLLSILVNSETKLVSLKTSSDSLGILMWVLRPIRLFNRILNRFLEPSRIPNKIMTPIRLFLGFITGFLSKLGSLIGFLIGFLRQLGS